MCKIANIFNYQDNSILVPYSKTTLQSTVCPIRDKKNVQTGKLFKVQAALVPREPLKHISLTHLAF